MSRSLPSSHTRNASLYAVPHSHRKTSPGMYDNVEPRVHQLDDLAVSYSIDALSRLHSTILRCTPPPKSRKRAVTTRTWMNPNSTPSEKRLEHWLLRVTCRGSHTTKTHMSCGDTDVLWPQMQFSSYYRINPTLPSRKSPDNQGLAPTTDRHQDLISPIGPLS